MTYWLHAVSQVMVPQGRQACSSALHQLLVTILHVWYMCGLCGQHLWLISLKHFCPLSYQWLLV